MRCPRCGKGRATRHNEYGILPCISCQRIDEAIKKPQHIPEFTTDSIRSQRREYKRDILQPFRDGVISKEYVDEYGTQGISVPKKMIDNARYTHRDTKGWWNRGKSKGGKRK